MHGIIGDTREMAASLRRAGAADRYDLVLTFDYENLQDPIAETARALKARLEAAGLVPGPTSLSTSSPTRWAAWFRAGSSSAKAATRSSGD